MINIFDISEIKYKILSYLNVCDILCYSLTCSNNLYILKDENFWIRRICEKYDITTRQAKYLVSDYKSSLDYLNDDEVYEYLNDDEIYGCFESSCPPMQYNYIYYASFHGYINQLSYLIGSDIHIIHLNDDIIETILIGATQGGQMDLVKKYKSWLTEDRRKTLILISRAIRYNQNELYQYLLSLLESNEIQPVENNDLIISGIIGGNLSIVKDLFYKHIIPTNFIYKLCSVCVEHDRFEILKFFVNHLLTLDDHASNCNKLGINIRLIIWSIEHDRLNIFNYLLNFPLVVDYNPSEINSLSVWQEILTAKPDFGSTNLEFLKHIFSIIPNNIERKILSNFLNNALINSINIDGGNEQLTKNLIYEIRLRKLEISPHIMSISIVRRNIEMISYLFLEGFEINLFKISTKLDINVMHFLINEISIDIKDILRHVILTNNLKGIIYLISNNIVAAKEILLFTITSTNDINIDIHRNNFSSRQCNDSTDDSMNESYYEESCDFLYNSDDSNSDDNESSCIKKSCYYNQLNDDVLQYIILKCRDNIDEILSLCIRHNKFIMFNNIMQLYDDMMKRSNQKYVINLEIDHSND